MAYDSQNVFAKILRGELPCFKLYEDEDTLSFMDIMPQADGHALVIPKEQAETLFDLSENGAQACLRTVRKVAKAVQKAMGSEGILVMQVNGAAAGQTVPHFHFHIIPSSISALTRAHAAQLEDAEKLQEFARRIVSALED
jgi:histidine triad (HIT) family protein